MLGFKVTFISVLISLSTASTSPKLRLKREEASYPNSCALSCNIANKAISACTAALPANFNSTTNIEADIAYLSCSCTTTNAFNIGSCTSCMSTLGNTTANIANINTSVLLDGSFLSAYNFGCQSYTLTNTKTWTNVTYTYGGGLDGKGAAIDSFAAVVVSSSAAPVATASASATPAKSGAGREVAGWLAVGVAGFVGVWVI